MRHTRKHYHCAEPKEGGHRFANPHGGKVKKSMPSYMHSMMAPDAKKRKQSTKYFKGGSTMNDKSQNMGAYVV